MYVDIIVRGLYHQLQDNNDSDDTIENDSSNLENILMPPNTRHPLGRPKKKRIHTAADELDEDENIQVRCGETGHSKRACHEAIKYLICGIRSPRNI